MSNMIKQLFKNTFHSSQSHIHHPGKPDYKAMAILVVVALSLSLIKYLGDFKFAVTFLSQIGLNYTALQLEDWCTIHPNAGFNRLFWWVSNVIVFYLIPPFILIKFVFKDAFSAYGLSLKGAFKDYKLYLIMLLVMIPLVLYFSRTQSFQQRYPFYDLQEGEPLFPNFILWELIYFVQFFALEFFFRGFMIHGTKQVFGFYSVFVMTIPYCMIHFGKPFPETIAAIIAGVVLGVLSLKSRSIWMGVAIHYSVAITMDLCSLYQKGIL
ncbi:MAG: CPBP family intramembrane metalloprotease [Bacteroidetes bacterium]|nr:CPBP family intramembrane metalloprotease [Bacteroidota bacterium]